MDEEKQKIDELNAQLDKLKQGTITELSESENLPTPDECMSWDTKQELKQYLIPDLVDIIEIYLNWKRLDHIPLFSVPLRKIRQWHGIFLLVQNIILFGRTDESEFTIIFNPMQKFKVKASGHFPLILDFNTCMNTLVDIQDDSNALYLIGFIRFDNSHLLYPNLNYVIFSWTKHCAKIVVYLKYNRVLQRNEVAQYNNILFMIRDGRIAIAWNPLS